MWEKHRHVSDSNTCTQFGNFAFGTEWEAGIDDG